MNRTTLLMASGWILAGVVLGAMLRTPSRVAMAADAPATTAPAAPPTPPVDVSTTILQRDGANLRLLNATVKLPESGEVRHVDVALTFDVSKEGKVSVTSVETTPTSLVGVNTLIAGTYTDGKNSYEIKGPALDVDMRATWTIEGKLFYGAVIAGPVTGHPQVGTLKSANTLPEGGVYGVVYQNGAFASFPVGATVVVSLKQVGDTIVVTGYTLGGKGYDQGGTVVLRRKQ